MAVSHQTGRARSGELSIHYRKLGRPGGTPILIVHGLSYFSYDWLGVAQSLGAGREVVAMDMRGFGDSDWSPSRDYSVAAMAQDIVSVLDHLRWSRALLAGHSMGGRSATWVARGIRTASPGWCWWITARRTRPPAPGVPRKCSATSPTLSRASRRRCATSAGTIASASRPT
jgi:hypothetical protein